MTALVFRRGGPSHKPPAPAEVRRGRSRAFAGRQSRRPAPARPPVPEASTRIARQGWPIAARAGSQRTDIPAHSRESRWQHGHAPTRKGRETAAASRSLRPCCDQAGVPAPQQAPRKRRGGAECRSAAAAAAASNWCHLSPGKVKSTRSRRGTSQTRSDRLPVPPGAWLRHWQ